MWFGKYGKLVRVRNNKILNPELQKSLGFFLPDGVEPKKALIFVPSNKKIMFFDILKPNSPLAQW